VKLSDDNNTQNQGIGERSTYDAVLDSDERRLIRRFHVLLNTAKLVEQL